MRRGQLFQWALVAAAVIALVKVRHDEKAPNEAGNVYTNAGGYSIQTEFPSYTDLPDERHNVFIPPVGP